MTTLPAYAHGASPVALLGDTVGDNLARTAARYPDRLALVSRAPAVCARVRPFWNKYSAGMPRNPSCAAIRGDSSEFSFSTDPIADA